MKRNRFLTAMGIVAALGAAIPSITQANGYPEKTVSWIAPFKPGGGADRWSRVLSSVALDVLDKPLRVRNIPGNSALRGWQHLLDQPADGHTVMLSSPTPLIALAREADNAPLSPEQIKIVSFISAFRVIVVAQPDQPWSSWDGLIEYAKQHPNELALGATIGDASGAALAFKDAGLQIKIVPYDSTSDAVTDFLGGHIQLAAATESTVIPMVPDRAVAVLNATKSPLSAEVSERLGNPPHAAALGYRAIDFPRWVGVHPDTPDHIVQMLSERIGAMLETDSFQKIMRKMGEEIIFVPREKAQQRYTELVAGVRVAVTAIQPTTEP